MCQLPTGKTRKVTAAEFGGFTVKISLVLEILQYCTEKHYKKGSRKNFDFFIHSMTWDEDIKMHTDWEEANSETSLT